MLCMLDSRYSDMNSEIGWLHTALLDLGILDFKAQESGFLRSSNLDNLHGMRLCKHTLNMNLLTYQHLNFDRSYCVTGPPNTLVTQLLTGKLEAHRIPEFKRSCSFLRLRFYDRFKVRAFHTFSSKRSICLPEGFYIITH